MSYSGLFTNNDDDIVTLKKQSPEHVAISGWVNVGTHAIFINLDQMGNLTVDVDARCNEGGPIKSLRVSAQQSRAHGGVDPD